MRNATLPLLASALLAGAAFADTPQTAQSSASEAQPDATFNLKGGSLAVGVGYVWGSGDLTYQGEKHAFRISGLSIVDVGAAHLNASGGVYNLTKLEDFNGTYRAAATSLTVVGGGSAAVLRNEHGVVIKVISTTKGLRFSLSAEGIAVKLRN
jgi:hypothetical protein